MPKKKRRPRKTHSGRTTPNQAARLGTAFRTSLLERGLDPNDAWIIETLIDLKRTHTDVPDPTVWPDQQTYELLTEVLPRKVHVMEQDRERIAPLLADFFTFLHDGGRWSPRSLPFHQVPDLIQDLSQDLPTALADPEQRGMTGNLIQYALSQGVDVTDQTAMAAFIQQYNSSDAQQRTAITDTGDAPSTSATAPAGAAFGLDAGTPQDGDVPANEDPTDDLGLEEVWPEFLGAPPDPDIGIARMESADPHELAATVLTQRADQVMALLADGRTLTKTNVLGRADTATLLTQFQIEESPRSMWDVPALALIWSALQGAGFIQIRGHTACPTGDPEAWASPEADADARLRSIRLLHAAMLAMLLGTDEDDHGATASPLVIPALLKAAEPEGLTVATPSDAENDSIAQDLIMDLSILVEAGLIERHAQNEYTFSCHPALIELTPAAIEVAMNHDPQAEDFTDDQH